eukprot:TRINITY_DN17974_c1_g1_i1.p1 TRINITY_DN17974_c1_g1~~TRINITY_DN17974_c1_g1_i1.p1  ORF type:complete len:396 (+),score=58.51 TRINITY_DN17974_c1_g1_i1:200-1387(+)
MSFQFFDSSVRKESLLYFIPDTYKTAMDKQIAVITRHESIPMNRADTNIRMDIVNSIFSPGPITDDVLVLVLRAMKMSPSAIDRVVSTSYVASRVQDQFKEFYDEVSGPVPGSFARLRCDGSLCQLKILRKDESVALLRELLALEELRHPNIINLHDVFREEDRTIFVLDYYPSATTLLDWIRSATVSEHDVQQIVIMMLNALDYIHENDFIHRNINMDTLLAWRENGQLMLKMRDLSLCTVGGATRMVGHPDFRAPEHYTGKPLNSQMDLWSVGCVVHTLHCGEVPFEIAKYDAMDKMLEPNPSIFFKPAVPSFSSNEWKSVSKPAREFVKALLVVNPEERMTVKQAKEHPWLAMTAEQIRHEAGKFDMSVHAAILRAKLRRYVGSRVLTNVRS